MIVTHKLTLPLDCRDDQLRIDAVQGDTARAVEFSLTENGEPWTAPEGTTAMVHYRRPKSGVGGSYDTLPDGTSAYAISEDKVTVYLTPQVVSVPGFVNLQVTLLKDGAEVTCFAIEVYVQGNLSNATTDDGNYVNLSAHIRTEAEKVAQEVFAEEMPAALPNPSALTINGQNYDGSEPVALELAKREHSVFFVVQDSTSSTSAWTATSPDITEYFDGLTIALKVVKGREYPLTTTLDINGLGAIRISKGNKPASFFPATNTVLLLTYCTFGTSSYWCLVDFEDPDADSKNTTGSANRPNAKQFLIGAITQSSTGTVTTSNVNCFIGTDNCLYSGGVKVMVEEDVTALINAAMDGIATAEGVSF